MLKPIFSLLSLKSPKEEKSPKENQFQPQQNNTKEKNTMSWLERYGKGSYVPKIHHNKEQKKFYILGASYMENSAMFFDELTNHLSQSLEKKEWESLHLSLDYFNSGSSKGLLKLFFTCKEWKSINPNFKIYWHFDESDTDLEEEIQDFIDDTKVEITLNADGYLSLESIA